MSNKRSMYSKLANSEDTPLFTVTPGKNCRMYPYLWSEECAKFYGPTGDPKDNPFRCNAPSPVDPGQAYLGYPVNFQYNQAGNPKRCGEAPAEYPPVIGQQQQRAQCSFDVQEKYGCQ